MADAQIDTIEEENNSEIAALQVGITLCTVLVILYVRLVFREVSCRIPFIITTEKFGHYNVDILSLSRHW